MNNFLSKVLKFLALLFSVNLLLFCFVKLFYIKDYEQVDLGFSEFILADSHGIPLSDFSEDYRVHNFSEHGDSYLDMERKIKYLIAETEVDKIYLTVDDHTLSPYRENFNNMDRSAYFSVLSDHQDVVEYVEEKYLEYYIVFLHDKYSLVIRNFIESELFDYTKWGGSKKTSWESLSKEAREYKSRMRIQDFFPNTEKSETLTETLNDIISLCKNNDIELIGIRFPLTESFHENLGSKSFNADSIFYQNELKVLDYDSLFFGQDTLFRDQDHLDAEGGDIFADILFEGAD